MKPAALLAIALLNGASVLVSSSMAADSPSPSLKSCNKEADAKGLTGKDRATFVRNCLSGKSASKD